MRALARTRGELTWASMPQPPPGPSAGAIAHHRALFHTGANSGYLAVNAWLPDERITLAVLSNDQASDILQATADLLEPAL